MPGQQLLCDLADQSAAACIHDSSCAEACLLGPVWCQSGSGADAAHACRAVGAHQQHALVEGHQPGPLRAAPAAHPGQPHLAAQGARPLSAQACATAAPGRLHQAPARPHQSVQVRGPSRCLLMLSMCCQAVLRHLHRGCPAARHVPTCQKAQSCSRPSACSCSSKAVLLHRCAFISTGGICAHAASCGSCKPTCCAGP